MTLVPHRERVERDEVFLEQTKSICPVCNAVVDAEVNARDNKVFLRNRCRDLGDFEASTSTRGARGEKPAWLAPGPTACAARSRSRSPSIRILFAFDPRRRAVLLIGGDKAGQWQAWYEKAIPVADDLFDEHLRETGQA